MPIENGKVPYWDLDTSDLQRLGTRGAGQTGQAGIDASDLQRFGTQGTHSPVSFGLEVHDASDLQRSVTQAMSGACVW